LDQWEDGLRQNKLHRLKQSETVGSHTILHYLGLRFGYLATSGAKSDVIGYSCSSTPIPCRGDKFRAYIFRVVSEIWRRSDRRQTDRRGDRNSWLSHWSAIHTTRRPIYGP